MGGHDTGPKDDQRDSQAEMHFHEAWWEGHGGMNERPVRAIKRGGCQAKSPEEVVPMWLCTWRLAGSLSWALDPCYRKSAGGN